jgi:hypothetical protein
MCNNNTQFCSQKWGGIICTPPNGGLNWVTATWTIPSITGPLVAAPNQDYVFGPGGYVASSWIGLDGASTAPGLLQAGVWSETANPGPNTNFFWFQWIPAIYTIEIENLPVAAGDTVSLCIQMIPGNGNLTADNGFLVGLLNTAMSQFDANSDTILHDAFRGGLAWMYIANVSRGIYTRYARELWIGLRRELRKVAYPSA